jgi:hypothetical protein
MEEGSIGGDQRLELGVNNVRLGSRLFLDVSRLQVIGGRYDRLLEAGTIPVGNDSSDFPRNPSAGMADSEPASNESSVNPWREDRSKVELQK